MNDCPDLDSIQRKERRLIKIRQEIREKKRGATKIREGIPPFKPKPPVNGEGVTSRNGLPTKPKLDTEVRKRAKRKKI